MTRKAREDNKRAMWRKKREPTTNLPLNIGGQLVMSQIQETEVGATVNEV